MQDNHGLKHRVKVCFVITKGNWGGAQKYVYELATSLPKDAFESVVICGKGEALLEKLKSAGIRTYRLPTLDRDISLVAEIKSSFALLKIIKNERPDVLHLNSPKASGFGAVAGRLCRTKKIIQTVHGFTWNENRSALATILISFFSWLTVMLCHKTIVIAKSEKKQAMTMPFVTEKKVVMVHNGIRGIEFKEKEIARRELLSTSSGAIWIGAVAELHKNKGLEYAIFALAKVTTPFVFFIIGEGEERKNLENLIVKNNLQEKVFLLGFRENANQYLKAFDIYVSSSIKEGLPYSVLEAGMASLPIISTKVGGIPEIIENSVSGILVTKGNVGEMTRAIEHLIENSDKQKIFGDNLKTKVEKEFSLKNMLEKTLVLYSD